ncbi:MAG: ATP-binding cassette domain-containing protein [Proteobacteria bacterium]|nr:ATP-binding cassette domain-containing protein [Pseudomonadota bacterium]
MILKVNNLKKHYGDVKAVDGISFSVKKGEIFGILGPNGAGKTTTLECIEGLQHHDEGDIEIFEKKMTVNDDFFKERMGIQLQESSLPPRMKVWEALDLFSSFYNKNVDWRELLVKLQLEDKKNNYFSSLSGGQKQRVFVALAMVNDPEVLFLDEITTGLDPMARRQMWNVMKTIKYAGKTVVMSTHYMEEAEYLCDRVMIIDKGKVIADGTPGELIDRMGMKNRVIIESEEKIDVEIFKTIKSVLDISVEKGKIEIEGKDTSVLADIARIINDRKIKANIQYKTANLEDVYLHLTDHFNEEVI